MNTHHHFAPEYSKKFDSETSASATVPRQTSNFQRRSCKVTQHPPLPPLVTCTLKSGAADNGKPGPVSAIAGLEGEQSFMSAYSEESLSGAILARKAADAAAAAGSDHHFQMMKTFSDSAHLPSIKQNKLTASLNQLCSKQYKEKALPSSLADTSAARAAAGESSLSATRTAPSTVKKSSSSINKRVEQALCPQSNTALPKAIQHSRCGPNNHGYDDVNNDYIIEIGEIWDNRYLIVKKLGRGSFGQVVEAYDQIQNVRLAIKIIKNRSAFYKQALVEEKVLKHLKDKDPYRQRPIVNLLGSFHQRNHLCMVYELLGVNLYEVLRMTQFQGLHLNAVREIARQLLVTLQFLSRRDMRIVHCDLKPENILVCDPASSSIKVIDFGSSCFEHEKLYNYIQSRFYRAPEILLGLTYTCAIDTWSLGCVLVELLTGEPLFPGQSEAEMISGMCKTIGSPPDYLLDLACPTTQTMLRHPEVIWGIKREKVAQWFRRTKAQSSEKSTAGDSSSKSFRSKVLTKSSSDNVCCYTDDESENEVDSYEYGDEDDEFEDDYDEYGEESDEGEPINLELQDHSDGELPEDMDTNFSLQNSASNTTGGCSQPPLYYQSAPQPNTSTSSASNAGSVAGGHWTCFAPLPQRHGENKRKNHYSSSWGGPNHELWEVLMRKMEQKERQIAASNGSGCTRDIELLQLPSTKTPTLTVFGREPQKISVATSTDCNPSFGKHAAYVQACDWMDTFPETWQMHGKLVQRATTARGVKLFYEKSPNKSLHEPLSAPECSVLATLGHTVTDFKHFYTLIRQLLQYDPVARITPERGLQSKFFRPHSDSASNTLLTAIQQLKTPNDWVYEKLPLKNTLPLENLIMKSQS